MPAMVTSDLDSCSQTSAPDAAGGALHRPMGRAPAPNTNTNMMYPGASSPVTPTTQMHPRPQPLLSQRNSLQAQQQQQQQQPPPHTTATPANPLKEPTPMTNSRAVAGNTKAGTVPSGGEADLRNAADASAAQGTEDTAAPPPQKQAVASADFVDVRMVNLNTGLVELGKLRRSVTIGDIRRNPSLRPLHVRFWVLEEWEPGLKTQLGDLYDECRGKDGVLEVRYVADPQMIELTVKRALTMDKKLVFQTIVNEHCAADV